MILFDYISSNVQNNTGDEKIRDICSLKTTRKANNAADVPSTHKDGQTDRVILLD